MTHAIIRSKDLDETSDIIDIAPTQRDEGAWSAP